MGVFKRKKEKIEELNKLKKDILNSYIYFAIREYGRENAIKQLNGYIKLDDLNCITRKNDFREKFKNYLSPKDIAELIEYNTVGEYIFALEEERNKRFIRDTYKEQLLEKAIHDTYLVRKNDEQVKLALKIAMKLNEFARISNQRTPGIRQEMTRIFNDGEVMNIVEGTFVRNKIPYNIDGELDEYAEQYIKYVTNQAIVFDETPRTR